jgi:DNA (cytosine-5)-methyltransferase 1
MKGDVVSSKIDRFRNGKALRVLDLFAGCGGLSLGFQAAGFEIAAAVEHDVNAAASHGCNFHPGDKNHSKARDITKVSARELCADLGLGKPEQAFDVIVGGPPCQAFARVGRSKLREVADHPEAFRHDPRARLYSEYLEYVTACQPLAVVLENVPDMLNHGGHNLADEICEVLSDRGYDCRYTLLNSAFYGVPQMRERMFLVAIKRGVGAEFHFPQPTHFIELPRGYEGSRTVALKLLNDLFVESVQRWFEPVRAADNELPAAVTAHDAIGDLPKIFARGELASGILRRGARKFDQPRKYDEPSSMTAYARAMRDWMGFEGTGEVTDHVIRYLPRDYKIFARLEPGDQYPEAYKLAEKMFVEALATLKERGVAPAPESDEWANLKASIVPPYDPGKFPNKWRKMEKDKPARTLLAHLGKDGYSHIHYDSMQARTISVREAARLQSFPDGFQFCGTMNPAFRQIGNAVPPLMAKALASSLRSAISDALSTEAYSFKEAS